MDELECILANIVETRTQENPNDINAAVEAVVEDLRDQGHYDALADRLILRAVRDLVHNRRHTVNVRTKSETGQYNIPARTRILDGAAVNNVFTAFVDSFYIGGRLLGSITGDEIAAIADQEMRLSNGHRANAELLRLLRRERSIARNPALPIRQALGNSRAADTRVRHLWQQARNLANGNIPAAGD